MLSGHPWCTVIFALNLAVQAIAGLTSIRNSVAKAKLRSSLASDDTANGAIIVSCLSHLYFVSS